MIDDFFNSFFNEYLDAVADLDFGLTAEEEQALHEALWGPKETR